MTVTTRHRDDASTRAALAGDRVDVVERADQHRYELRVDGAVRGLIVYADHGAVRALVHTEIDAPLQGRGLAGRLTRRALDDIEAAGRRVNLSCPYAQWFVERHPEYAALVA